MLKPYLAMMRRNVKTMKNKMTLEWIYAALARAIKTVAQTALGMFTVGAAINEIDWKYVASVSLVAGLFSLLTSIATSLPEVGKDGALQIDTTDEEKDTYLLALDEDLEKIKQKKYIRLQVDPTARLNSQE